MTSQMLIRDLIKSLAKKYKLTEEQIKKIINSPFDVTVEAMKSGDRKTQEFPSIRIINFGLFYVPENKKAIMKHFVDKRKHAVIHNRESESKDTARSTNSSGIQEDMGEGQVQD